MDSLQCWFCTSEVGVARSQALFKSCTKHGVEGSNNLMQTQHGGARHCLVQSCMTGCCRWPTTGISSLQSLVDSEVLCKKHMRTVMKDAQSTSENALLARASSKFKSRDKDYPVIVVRSFGRPSMISGAGTAQILDQRHIPYFIALSTEDPHISELLTYYARHANDVIFGLSWTQRMTRFLLQAAKMANIPFLYILDDNISKICGSVGRRTVELSSHQLLSVLRHAEKETLAHNNVAVSISTTQNGYHGNNSGSVRRDRSRLCIRSRDLHTVKKVTHESRGLLYGAVCGYSSEVSNYPPFESYQKERNCRDDMEATVCFLMGGKHYSKLRHIHAQKINMKGGQNALFKTKRARAKATLQTDCRILNDAAALSDDMPVQFVSVIRLWSQCVVFKPSLKYWMRHQAPASLKRKVKQVLDSADEREEKIASKE